MAHRIEQAEAVEPRHHHVRQQEIGQLAPDCGERGFAVGDGLHPVAMPAQQPLDIIAHIGIVVGEHDPPAASRERARRAGRQGRAIVDQFARFGQPAYRFLDESVGIDRPRLRQLGLHIRRIRQAHDEGRALAELARRRDRATMETHQFLHQGKPDAAALIGPSGSAFDTVEALEQARHFLFCHADAGIGDAHLGPGAVGRRLDRDRHPAFERELEGVGQQVEQHLFPHVPVERDGMRQGPAFDPEVETGFLHRRTKAGGDVDAEGGQIGRLAPRLDASCLDPREIEQAVDEPQQADAVAVRQFDLMARGRRIAPDRGRHHLLERAEHQGQRGAEFVADVGEERRLGTIDLGQRLGAVSLLLVSARGGERGAELVRQQRQEIAIGLVERPIGIEPDDQVAGQRAAHPLRDRQDQAALGRFAPMAGRRLADPARQILEFDRAALGGYPLDRPCHVDRFDAGSRDQAIAAGPAQVGQGERQIDEIMVELLADRGEEPALARRDRGRGGEFAHRAEAALVQDAIGLLHHHAEHADDRAGIVEQRAVGEGVVGFLAKPAALEKEQHAFGIGRLAGAQYLVDHRAYVGPDFGPDEPRRLPQRPREFDAEGRDIGIVAEEGQLRAPRHPHLVARREHHAHDRAQAGRPLSDRPERRRRPVELAHEAADAIRADEGFGRARTSCHLFPFVGSYNIRDALLFRGRPIIRPSFRHIANRRRRAAQAGPRPAVDRS